MATATAPSTRPRTLRPMTDDPTTRYLDLLTELLRGPTRSTRLLAVPLLTLARHYEILEGAVTASAGALHIRSLAFNQQVTIARDVPLAGAARALLDGREGNVADTLALPVAQRGGLLALVRADLRSLEVAHPPELEDLHLVAAAALVHRAPDTAGRQAVLAYAGIPPATATAAKQRARHLPGSLTGVAAAIDDLVREAGIDISTGGLRAHG